MAERRQSLRSLEIRSRAGATIVGIRRADQLLMNPAADETLGPRDVVVWMAKPAQVARARELLTAPAATDGELP